MSKFAVRMELNTIHNQFQILVNELRDSSGRRQTGDQYIFQTHNFEKTVDLFNKNNIIFDELTPGLLSIELRNCIPGIAIFSQEENFRQGLSDIMDESLCLRKHVGILENGDSYLFFDHDNQRTYFEGVLADSHIITNALQSFRLTSAFKNPTFSDYINYQQSELVLYSVSKGILKMELPEYPFKLDDSIDFQHLCDDLIKKIDNSSYTIHFKNQLFTLPKENGKSTIKSVFLHLPQLIQAADNDYQLQLKNFSFDKFKNDLQKEKEKYFSSLREILNKILSQVVGVPVSIAASTYATYKVDNVFVIVLVLIALGSYILFAIYFQYIYWIDINEIEKDLEQDFKKIEQKSGLKLDEISTEQSKINRRIKTIKKTISVYIILIISLFIMFLLFMTSQIKQSNKDNKSIPFFVNIHKYNKESYFIYKTHELVLCIGHN